jgi:hypothetical protein
VAEAEDELQQAFTVATTPEEALNRAATYLEGAGTVAAGLRGRIERYGDRLVIHHGRVRTGITTHEVPHGTRVEVRRTGAAPFENTRRWLVAGGLAAFLGAWALAVFRRDDALPPLPTITLVFLGIVSLVIVLYVVDRSLERRGRGLLLSLEDAMRGDPLLVLQAEIQALERSSAVANALLFYFFALVADFFLFALLWSDGFRDAIDQAVTLRVMRAAFLLPVAPAALFGIVSYTVAHRVHARRMDLVERRLGGVPA